jgi:hypothetical protein
MNLTEEQKECLQNIDKTFIALGRHLPGTHLRNLFPEAFEQPKPERKFIDVRIEYDKELITIGQLRSCLEPDFNFLDNNLTVTELPRKSWDEVKSLIELWNEYVQYDYADTELIESFIKSDSYKEFKSGKK